jgi:hypothetical protein
MVPSFMVLRKDVVVEAIRTLIQTSDFCVLNCREGRHDQEIVAKGGRADTVSWCETSPPLNSASL